MDLVYDINVINIIAFLANLIGILCNVPLIVNTIRNGKADDKSQFECRSLGYKFIIYIH